MSIEINHLAVTLDGLPVLKQIELNVVEGSFVSLIAPSGAGKSTLLKTLTGVLTPTEGEISVDGQKITGITQQFSYMPQEDMLLPWLSVKQNVSLYQKINHLPVDETVIEHLSKIAGLTEYQNFLPEQLSGGMRKRTALLRTMANPAKYLLLDEPFGALDSMTRSLMQDWLLSLPQELRRTTLLVTHDIEEAIYLSDRIIVLSARPAKVIADFKLAPEQRNRTWLAKQAPLKEKIYHTLQEESYV